MGRRFGKRWRGAAAVLAATVALTSGCGGGAGQRVLATVFNRVPAFPEREEACADLEQARGSAAPTEPAAVQPVKQVFHAPYEEKRCPDCHTDEKDLGGGLVAPRERLCFKCHPTILKHRYAHGPASEGDCLACHLPHTSNYPSLLVTSRDKICAQCHLEQRLAAGMHARVTEKGMSCADCHDPHSGSGKYFLK